MCASLHAKILHYIPCFSAAVLPYINDDIKQVQVEKSLDGSSRRQELRDVDDRQRATSIARAGGQVIEYMCFIE